MSATLFGRGVMAQVGARQRAEATDKAITALRTEMAETRGVVTTVRALEARLQATERKAAALEAELEKLKVAAAASAAAASPAPASTT
jgi:hypothetical protein